MIERALMEGGLDPFDFILAEALHMTLGDVRELPNAEVTQWRAFYAYRAAMRELAASDMKKP